MQFLTTTESYISLFFTLALMLVMLYFMIYRPCLLYTSPSPRDTR